MRIHRVLSRLLVACVIVLPLAGCAAVTFRVDPIDSEPANKRGWSRVATLPRTSDVIVTREGAPASRTFGAANESELITLNLAGPTLPRPVKGTFRDLATDRPLDLFKVSDGQTLIDGRVRIEGDSIFLDGNRVATLDRVLGAGGWLVMGAEPGLCALGGSATWGTAPSHREPFPSETRACEP